MRGEMKLGNLTLSNIVEKGHGRVSARGEQLLNLNRQPEMLVLSGNVHPQQEFDGYTRASVRCLDCGQDIPLDAETHACEVEKYPRLRIEYRRNKEA